MIHVHIQTHTYRQSYINSLKVHVRHTLNKGEDKFELDNIYNIIFCDTRTHTDTHIPPIIHQLVKNTRKTYIK